MGKDGGGGGGGGGSAAFLYGLIALIYIGLFAVRTNYELGFFSSKKKNNNSYFPTSVVAKNNLCMQVMIWFLSQPKSLDRMKNRWWVFFPLQLLKMVMLLLIII